MNPRDLAQLMLTSAKATIESGREAMPVCALFNGDIQFIMMPWQSPQHKAISMAALRKTLAVDQTITVYCLLSEAWMSVIAPADARGVSEIKHMPRDDPERKEVLIVSAGSRAGDSVQLTAEIKTLPDGKRCVMQPTEVPADAKSYGQMVNLFAPIDEGQ